MIPVSSPSIHLTLMLDALAGVQRAAEAHGDVVMHRIGRTRLVQVTHPDDIHTVLHARWPVVKKSRVVKGLADIVGDGLLTADGEAYTALRKVAAPRFTPRHIDGWARRMGAIAASAEAPVGEVDVLPHLTSLTLDLLVDTVFGTDPGPELADALGCLAVLLDDFQAQTYSWQRLLPEILTPGRVRRRHAMKAGLRSAVDALVARRTRRGPGGDDLLGSLLFGEDTADPETLYAHLLTLLVAGHETTALTLGFALHHLASRPDAVERLRREAWAVGGVPRCLADLQAMPFARAVVQETLRLTPTVFGMGREIVEPLALREHVLEPGMQVVTPQWVVHRDPRWWADPLAWTPERWMEAAERPRYAYFPFGGGPRVCIGNHFALLESVIVLATLVERVELSDPAPLALRPTLTLRPADGVRLTLAPRRQQRSEVA
ncbi:MAG: cytochrome P450 [Alphaproteobacteria bacterium]|nr:cytochrome P450 [Alphaproteobacteria bacterium]